MCSSNAMPAAAIEGKEWMIAQISSSMDEASWGASECDESALAASNASRIKLPALSVLLSKGYLSRMSPDLLLSHFESLELFGQFYFQALLAVLGVQ